MAIRGDKLREHILWTAKDVFLEMGFERASMDVVANQAETSKRTLYAHFESKERLFLAVIDLVRGLLLARLKSPGDYSDKPAEALVIFCGRYLETMLYDSSIRLCRVSLAETARFPDGAAEHFDVMFTEVQARLGAYLRTAFGLPPKASAEAAQRLLAQIIYPRLLRALFGVDAPADRFNGETVSPDFDLKPVRKAVADLIESLTRD
jgi:AcrR family transcriptional regulator